MIRSLVCALAVSLACGAAEAQAPKPQEQALRRLGPLSASEIISVLPGRWEYRPEDGWGKKSTSEPGISCAGSAERIWLEREAEGLVYYAQVEKPGSPKSRSPVRVDMLFGRPVIRIQYDGEKRLDENGNPVVWELFMPDSDTFYWHRVGWPPGATTAIVRRCKEQVVS